MLELAGEIADGAVLWLTPPAYVREVAVPAIAQGRQRAGKTLEGFEIVTAVPLAITHERTPALAAFRAELTRYLQLPFYRAMLERAGLGDGLRPSTVTARRRPRSPRPWAPWAPSRPRGRWSRPTAKRA